MSRIRSGSARRYQLPGSLALQDFFIVLNSVAKSVDFVRVPFQRTWSCMRPNKGTVAENDKLEGFGLTRCKTHLFSMLIQIGCLRMRPVCDKTSSFSGFLRQRCCASLSMANPLRADNATFLSTSVWPNMLIRISDSAMHGYAYVPDSDQSIRDSG